jgi:type I restriction enzyme S subunit
MVPDGWGKGTFAEGIDLISGQHVEAQYVNEVGEGCSYLTGPADFTNGKIIVTKYTDQGKKFSQNGDILITVKGSGTGKVIKSNGSYAISRQLMAIRPTSFDARFTYYSVVSSLNRYEGAAAGLIPGISREDVLGTPLLIPPMPEQRKIAQVLSIWDQAITATVRLLEKSQQRKKGLMQQLLTGMKRLPGFEGEWKKTKLDSMIQEVKKEKVDQPSAIELLTVKLHYKGIVPSGKFPTPTSNGRPYYRRAAGELIIGRQNIHNGGVGIVPDKCNGLIASNAISSYEPADSADINFIRYFMSTDRFRFIVDNLSGGTGQKELSSRELLKIAVKMPSENEQKAIAEVLATSDAEIQSIQHLLSGLKQEKKALMQQLLTGKRRVKVEAA